MQHRRVYDKPSGQQDTRGRAFRELTQERVVELLKDAWKKRNEEDFRIYFVGIEKADMDKLTGSDIEK